MEVKITIKYSFKRKDLKDQLISLALREGTTLDQLIDKLEIDRDLANLTTVNGVKKMPDTILHHGAEVVIWPILIGGG